MKFIKTHTDYNGNFLETAMMELREDAHLDDVLETFTRFLRAVGYSFDGQVEIVQETEYKEADWSGDSEAPEFEGPIAGFDHSKESADWPFPLVSKP